MGLIEELHPYVGATWREIFEMVTETEEPERKALVEALQERLGRPDLEESGLIEMIWLAVGIRKPRFL